MSNQAEKVTFINARGQEVVLTNRLPYLLESVEGKGDVQANIQTITAPYQDGNTHLDTILEPRELILTLAIIEQSRDELSASRRQLSSVFNPKLGVGKLVYENGSLIREIDVSVDGVPIFPTGDGCGKWWQRSTINLIAHDPYWKSQYYIEKPMAAFVPMFSFPLKSPFQVGMEGHTRSFENTGDAAAPINIKINGPTKNPTLTNVTTNESIRVKCELSADDTLEINTANNNKYIRLNGVNAFHLIDLSSTFWKLNIGENEVQFTADEGKETATLEVRWQERFVGI